MPAGAGLGSKKSYYIIARHGGHWCHCCDIHSIHGNWLGPRAEETWSVEGKCKRRSLHRTWSSLIQSSQFCRSGARGNYFHVCTSHHLLNLDLFLQPSGLVFKKNLFLSENKRWRQLRSTTPYSFKEKDILLGMAHECTDRTSRTSRRAEIPPPERSPQRGAAASLCWAARSAASFLVEESQPSSLSGLSCPYTHVPCWLKCLFPLNYLRCCAPQLPPAFFFPAKNKHFSSAKFALACSTFLFEVCSSQPRL